MGDESADRVSDRAGQLPAGAIVGTTATIVQFSSAFCQPCRATRRTIETALDDVRQSVFGISFIEIDADENLELTRSWGVVSTPTVVFLGGAGQEVYRASGQPRKADVIAALGRVIAPSGA